MAENEKVLKTNGTNQETELMFECDTIFIYRQWCKGCGICVAFCPKDVLAIGPDGKVYIAQPEKCVSCGMCDLRCPDFAITGLRKDKMSGKKQF